MLLLWGEHNGRKLTRGTFNHSHHETDRLKSWELMADRVFHLNLRLSLGLRLGLGLMPRRAAFASLRRL